LVPPTNNSYKLNFDGAAKGNPEPTGFGGVFRNNMGIVLHIYYGTIGKDTNKAVNWKVCGKGFALQIKKTSSHRS